MDIIHNNESMMLLQETKKDLSILSDDFSESRTPVITKIEERFAFIRELLKKLSKETILQQTDLLEVLTEKLQDLEKSISLVISVLSKVCIEYDYCWGFVVFETENDIHIMTNTTTTLMAIICSLNSSITIRDGYQVLSSISFHIWNN